MKIVAFVGETFQKHKNSCYTKPTSAAFLQEAIGKENVYVCSPIVDVDEKPSDFSTEVELSQFHAFPNYSSTKSFAINTLSKRGYLKKYSEAADAVILKHKGATFWIRTPSVGSIVFGLRVLAAGETLIHHMCADATNTWRDSKYSLPEKVFGFLLSRFLRYQLAKICQNQNTVNLCTGDVLEAFSKRYSPNRTYQFVDLMVKQPDILTLKQTEDSTLKLIFVGRIVEDKGVFDLMQVVQRFNGKVSVKIVGGGPDFEKAIEYSKTHNIESCVTFTGQLSHSVLTDLYCESDAVVVPSNNFYEGFPRVIMEGWAHNKPVIVSRVGGVMAFVQHNKNGLIFEPGNRDELHSQISALLTDGLLFAKLKDGAKSMAKISTQQYWLDFLNDALNRELKNEA